MLFFANTPSESIHWGILNPGHIAWDFKITCIQQILNIRSMLSQTQGLWVLVRIVRIIRHCRAKTFDDKFGIIDWRVLTPSILHSREGSSYVAFVIRDRFSDAGFLVCF